MAGWHARRVGGFVLAGIALLVLAVVLVGSGALFGTRHKFVTYFTGSVDGLRVGAPVKFRGIPIGQVTGVYIALTGQVAQDRVPVVFEIDERMLRSRGAAARLGDPTYVDSLVQLGLRAQLELESFVTGQRFVSLNFAPGAPAVYGAQRDIHYPEIPSIEQPSVQQDLTSFLQVLREADIPELVRRLTSLAARADTSVQGLRVPEVRARMDSTMRVAAQMMDEIAALARTLNDRVPEATDRLITTSAQLASLLEEAEQTLRTTAEVVASGSPVMVELEASLREIAGAARALRQLTEYLERNPSALLRGRAEEGKP